MNPYIQQQAETLNAAWGISVVGNESKGVYVTDIHAGDSMRVANVDFGNEGAKSITLRVAAEKGKGILVVRQDNALGKVLARVKIEATGGNEVWEERTFDLDHTPIGTHDLHFSFVGTGDETLFNWDWWQFNEDASAIDGLSYTASKEDNTYYTLQGMPVAHPTKGFYLRKGKKVFIP